MPSKPEWATAPLKRFLAQNIEFKMLLVASMQGIRTLRRTSGLDADLTTLAANEFDKGYPLLNAHALVGLWGAFEAMIDDLLVGFLVNEPASLRNETFAKLKIPQAVRVLEKDEQMRWLIAKFRLTIGKRRGVDRVELLLTPFGLSGAVDADIKQEILGMHHIRNVLVHRASIADRRVVEGCPWLHLTVGEPILVNIDMFKTFSSAMDRYVLEVVHRVNDKFGIDTRTRAKPLPTS